MDNSPVQAVIGYHLDVHGAGFDQANNELNKHLHGWSAVEDRVAGVGTKLDGVLGRVAQLGGAVGIAGLLGDFVNLENQANRVALAVGNITGGASGYSGIGQGLLGAGRATSMAATDLAGGLTALQLRAGGHYLTPGTIPGVARSLGYFAGAYGLQPQQLGAQVGTLELFQRMNAGSTAPLLAQLAAQAQAAGMAGQTGVFTDTVTGLVQGLVGAHPAAAGPGISTGVGALYGAAQSVNPAFRDANVFGAGIQGIDSALSGAYQNPRLMAALSMMGISYRDAREGLAGPNRIGIAKRIMSWADRMYGHGSNAELMFLDSNFGGQPGADLLTALATGSTTLDQLQHPNSAAGQAEIRRRAQQYATTPGAALQRGRNAAEDPLFKLLHGPLGGAINLFADHPLEGLAALYGAKKALPYLLRRGGGALLRQFGLSEGAAAARGAAGDFFGVGLRGGANLFRIGISAAPEAVGGASLGDLAGGSLLGELGGATVGSILTGGIGAYAGALVFPDSTVSGKDEMHALHAHLASIQRARARNAAAAAQKRYGPGWWTNPKGIGYAFGMLKGDPGAQKYLKDAISSTARIGGEAHGLGAGGALGLEGLGPFGALLGLGADALTHGKHGGVLGGLLDGVLGNGHGTALTDAAKTQKFSTAVDKFAHAINLLVGPGAGRAGAAYTGATGGALNAAALQGQNDVMGSNLILARAIAGAGAGGGSSGGGSGNQLVDFQGGAIGASTDAGANAGAGAISPGGWSRCLLTWYDPALGGTNSGSGRKDPHSPNSDGTPYSATDFHCAAPPSYPFGTLIAFRYRGKTVTCTVKDRGGAIQGNHFDLSRKPATVLGVIGPGKVNAEFKVLSGGGGRGSRGGGQGNTPHPHTSTAKAMAAASDWLGGGSAAGGGAGGGGGGGGDVIVNVDGRKIDQYRALTRQRV